MANKKILFVTQEITPYLAESESSLLGRKLPQGMQERGFEVRTFMPKYGCINERRNQLHEVIRLSGMNLIINDTDHPLIIKVASLQPSRIQVYFIDNEDYFQKSEDDIDDVGSNRNDNDERAIFFARGTMETVKKLNWEPAIIHCQGWMSAMMPLYLKTMYADDPPLRDAKIIYCVNSEAFEGNWSPTLFDKLKFDNVFNAKMKNFDAGNIDINTLHKIAISYSDGVIFNHANASDDLIEFVKNKKLPYLTFEQASQGLDSYAEFYNSFIKDEE